MDPNTGHLVSDLEGLVSPEKRKQYQELNAKQAELAKELLNGQPETMLTRQQIRRLQRLVDKQESK
jgi:hypothetical protein